MNLKDLAQRAMSQLPIGGGLTPRTVQPVENLTILRHHRPTSFEASIYEPVICLILQGRKETVLGTEAFRMGPGDCLLITHDLPVVARIVQAPYLALLFDVDLETLRELYDAIADALPGANAPRGLRSGTTTPPTRALAVHACDAALLDALGRYLALASGSRADAAVLGPLVSREIHYRLAMAPFGGMLRDLIRRDSHASAISRALAQLRRDFRTRVEIPALAKSVGMSASAFHKHFKSVTSSSPLQYQKELRLLEARRLLRAGSSSVSSAAYSVGYESLTQFSREYARKFGMSPRHDLPA